MSLERKLCYRKYYAAAMNVGWSWRHYYNTTTEEIMEYVKYVFSL